MLLGAIYRKGLSSSSNDKLLRDMLDKISASYDKIMICGDFNHPSINWKENVINDTAYSSAMKFYDNLNNNFLKQHVKEITRVRGNDKPSTLDLVITEDIQTQVSPSMQINAPLGCSDHAVLNWSYLVAVKDDDINDTTIGKVCERFNYFKGNYDKFRLLCSEVDWDSKMKEGSDIDSKLEILKSEIDRCKRASVPIFKSNNKHRRQKPPYLTRNSKQ